ncbi:hypothetical protein NL676_012623 [Syzygium grande]|nr:hypothetical protein NL676_012623 [Syzygium grande]
MAIISDFKDEEEKQPEAKPSASSSAMTKFSVRFDSSSPLGFIKEAFEFVAREKERAKKAKEAAAAKKVEEEKKVQEVEMKDAEEEEEEKSGAIVPNKSNGLDLDLESYSWTQTLQEVTVHVPVPKGTKGRFVVCDTKKNHLKVGFKGQPPVIEGELFRTVKPDDCYWSLEDQSAISILLTKHNQMEWWKSLVKGILKLIVGR